MNDSSKSPLLSHPVNEASAFTAQDLLDEVRRLRGIRENGIPAVCILEFDGDLTDWLVSQGIAKPCPSWPCFHTTMYALDLDGLACGIIPRTIGGPYAVLIAEQLHAAGAKLIVGLTSAGRVAPDLPIPSLVVVTSAIRDEGTSLHYLPPGNVVDCTSPMTARLAEELKTLGIPVRAGRAWTTDAPYRETPSQLEKWAQEGVLAVEMQAASLLAFASAKNAHVVIIARISNAVDHVGEQFDTGTQHEGLALLKVIARAAKSFIKES